MDDETGERSKSKSWLPMLLAVSAFTSAWVYSETESDTVRQIIPVVFGLFLGLALVLWGIADLRDGKIRGRNKVIYQAEYPRIFQAMVWGKRFLPGVLMMIAGLWFALSQG